MNTPIHWDCHISADVPGTLQKFQSKNLEISSYDPEKGKEMGLNKQCSLECKYTLCGNNKIEKNISNEKLKFLMKYVFE